LVAVQVTPFLLDRWLNEHQFSTPPIEFDLAASTGPQWLMRDFLAKFAPDALEQLLDAPISYGPASGSWALRTVIGEMAGVEPEDVTVVTGASEAIWILLMVARQPGANVVLPTPGYPTFDEAARHLGCEVRRYRLQASSGHGLDLDEIVDRIDEHTALVVVNTPHNPTGAVVRDDQLVELHGVVAERGVQLVVDEVYHPIYHGPASMSASRLPGATTVSDLSKALCLSGLRIGWIIDHDRARVEQYEDARSYLTISSAAVSEVLAEAAVRGRDEIVARAQAVTDRNMATLDDFFVDHAERFAWVRPSGGMTAFPWLRSGADSRPLCMDAAAAGVLVAPGDCFGMPSHIRIGFGAVEHDFDVAVDRLAHVVDRAG
jgi:aspartate/methionine/tyrosine aminotransferase